MNGDRKQLKKNSHDSQPHTSQVASYNPDFNSPEFDRIKNFHLCIYKY